MGLSSDEVAWEIAEFLFGVATDTEHYMQYMASSVGDFDPQTRTGNAGYLIPYRLLPGHLVVTPAVEYRLRSIFDEFSVLCQPVNDQRWGRCFELDEHDALQGLSWDEFRNRPGMG